MTAILVALACRAPPAPGHPVPCAPTDGHTFVDTAIDPIPTGGSAATGSTGGSAPTTTPCLPRFPGDPSCDGAMFYGASVEGGAPTTLEAQTGRTLVLYRSYFDGGDDASKLVARASDDLDHGRIPLMSTKLPGPWADVASGVYDDWLLDRITGLAALSGPVWLCLHHEPTNDGPPADWIAMQQHARTLIDANSTNIALVGILNGWDFLEPNPAPEVWNHPVGTGVHVMGFDSYNPWSEDNGKNWNDADYVLSPGATIATWGYPTLIAEHGVRTDPAYPGKAAQWMRDSYDYALANGFVGMSYFDSGANSPDGTWAFDDERLPVFEELEDRPETAHL